MKRRTPEATPVGGAARVFRIGAREAVHVRRSPTGDVGLLFAGEGLEAVWVSKGKEKIDPGWFRYPWTDLLVVVKGRLKVEFQEGPHRPRVLRPGDVLVLPPRAGCRAYRWPRDASRPTIFIAVYRTARTSHARGSSAHRNSRSRSSSG